ncbi:MAG TPA: hypothetical protein VHV08_00170 [Pirellulales bacterium]|nr:hypothetical protein [Pirellulales bacterium]
MNYFAHGRRFIDDPYFLAGTAVPDWLNVVDRRTRVRSKQAEAFCEATEAQVARLAAGIMQHHRDDAWFHATRAFAETSLELCRRMRQVLPADDGFRPHFLGHILVEILLDAALIADDPPRLAAYYEAVKRVDGAVVEAAVSAMSGRPTPNLGTFVGLFSRERFLSDYSDDAKLWFRLNQVMRRVRLPLLGPNLVESLPAARGLVAERKDALLAA